MLEKQRGISPIGETVALESRYVISEYATHPHTY